MADALKLGQLSAGRPIELVDDDTQGHSSTAADN